MLYTPVNHFNWSVSNFTNYFGDGTGTTLTADGAAHTKGANAAVMTGFAYDVWGISLLFTSGATDTAIRRQMIDLLIDPAAGIGNAGSSWTALINNLFTNSPSLANGNTGFSYYFPLFIPAGTAVGARTQDVVGGATVICYARFYGKPTRPELAKVGHKVQTIGATTASTSGVAVTPGSSALGSYTASMGTLTNDAWWWQVGVGSADATMNTRQYAFDIAHDATAKYICAQAVTYHVAGGSSFEGAGKMAYGDTPPIRHAPAGTNVYVRGTSMGGAPDSSMTTVVYAVT